MVFRKLMGGLKPAVTPRPSAPAVPEPEEDFFLPTPLYDAEGRVNRAAPESQTGPGSQNGLSQPYDPALNGALPGRLSDSASTTNGVKRAAERRVRPVARLRPRWHKVFSDLWGNKVRTALVVASVAIGLFAIGMIATINALLTSDMRESYARVSPANIQVNAADFNNDIVEQVRGLAGVKNASGVRAFDVMVKTGPDQWSRLSLQAVEDFGDKHINQVELLQGAWPPADHQIVIERNKIGQLPAGVGGVIEVKLPDGKIRRMALTGAVHDLTIGATSGGGGFFMAPITGFITLSTAGWLEQPETYNQLLVTVTENGDDETHLRAVANTISKAMENGGALVYNAMIRGTHNHPNASYVEAMTGVLFLLGGLVVFLSAFLITNTLQALLNQQAQQIAIMKTVGARSRQVIGIYLALIFAFGVLALIFSLPLSRQAAFIMLDFFVPTLNFKIIEYRTSPLAVILQVVIALLVPQLAGIVPVLRGSHIKVQDVLAGSLSEDNPNQHGWLDRRVARVRRLSRPNLISLRNTFRNKGRLALTLLTLTLGGAIFIGTFNVRASMENYIDRLTRYFMADVNLTMGQPYRISQIQEALKGLPEVGAVEGWTYARAELLTTGDQAADAVQMMAPPGDSQMIESMMLKGRWITSSDQGAVVLSERFMERYPNLQVGDTLRMRVNGDKSDWKVVGIFQLAGKSAGFVAYTNYEYLSKFVHEPNRAFSFRVNSVHKNLTDDEQQALGVKIETYLQERGYNVNEVQAGHILISNTARGLNMLTTFLLIMAALTAGVGSIGLMGTMSMNVLDRTREIGIMRAIGASDRAVMNLVLVEGVLIGLISWLLGTLLAIPISSVLSDSIHMALFQARSELTFTATGPLAWLGLVLALSVLASVLPARSAAQLTIREALAYE